MTASLPDRLRKLADEFESMRCVEDAALMREAAEALDDLPPLGATKERYQSALLRSDGPASYAEYEAGL